MKFKEDFPRKGVLAIHYKSKENSLCPPKPKIIRGDTPVAGYLLEEECDS
jgi:hypothetical protein